MESRYYQKSGQTPLDRQINFFKSQGNNDVSSYLQSGGEIEDGNLAEEVPEDMEEQPELTPEGIAKIALAAQQGDQEAESQLEEIMNAAEQDEELKSVVAQAVLIVKKVMSSGQSPEEVSVAMQRRGGVMNYLSHLKCGGKTKKKEVGGKMNEVPQEKCGGKAKKVKKSACGAKIKKGERGFEVGYEKEKTYKKILSNGGKAKPCNCKSSFKREGGRIVITDCNGNIIR